MSDAYETYVRHEVARIRKWKHEKDRDVLERYADRKLVRMADNAMEEKLAAAREKGRGGWWDQEVCSVEYLRELLQHHMAKGDMRDVVNLAAMIYIREIVDSEEPK